MGKFEFFKPKTMFLVHFCYFSIRKTYFTLMLKILRQKDKFFTPELSIFVSKLHIFALNFTFLSLIPSLCIKFQRFTSNKHTLLSQIPFFTPKITHFYP
jgi:hypothetical protein